MQDILHSRVGHLNSTTTISLLGDRQLDTLAFWQTDPWLLLANDEHIALSSSERVVNGIFDVDNVETTIVSLAVSYDANTTHIATTSDHSDHTSIESNEVGDLPRGEVDLNGIVNLDGRIGV